MANDDIINNTTPIQRLREFVAWAKGNNMCESERDFERQCELSPKYLANNSFNGKGNLGTEILGRIVLKYPMLNLAWLCTGDGSMINGDDIDYEHICSEAIERAISKYKINKDYKKAYESAMMQVEALNRIIGER